jgi:hypothetical protein
MSFNRAKWEQAMRLEHQRLKFKNAHFIFKIATKIGLFLAASRTLMCFCLDTVNAALEKLSEEVVSLELKMAKAEELQAKIDDFDQVFADYLKHN